MWEVLRAATSKAFRSIVARTRPLKRRKRLQSVGSGPSCSGLVSANLPSDNFPEWARLSSGFRAVFSLVA
jgi:hypothetical protein